ncbi:hypothetical protein PVAG01_03091 [Phlyctema vagabunda]|uniref:NYN domain-containing protein n=1 Tax=Phlyctema vagabunda TaxID=108571 RepID=A0ABR4PSJ3_9HELO
MADHHQSIGSSQPARIRRLGDLSPVLRLLESHRVEREERAFEAPTTTSASQPPASQPPAPKPPVSLGDFERLWPLLSQSLERSLGADLRKESESTSSEVRSAIPRTTIPGPTTPTPEAAGSKSRSKHVQFVDANDDTDSDLLGVYVAAALRSRTKTSTKSRRKPRSSRVEKDSFYTSEFDSDGEKTGHPSSKVPQRVRELRILERSIAPTRTREVAPFALPYYKPEPPMWVPPAINQAFFQDPTRFFAKHTWTAAEKRVILSKKLEEKYGLQQTPASATATTTTASINSKLKQPDDGIHVFIDLSNIVIGFFDELKRVRNIPIQTRLPQPPICFENLALILERGRTTTRKILAGSQATGSAASSPKKMEYLPAAAKCGYELNILERVSKYKEVSSPYNRRAVGSGYGTSSGSEGPAKVTKFVMTEQGVDELLHMKLLESIVDFKPSTIVLASGDAAVAEYSSGFLRNVERAMEKGWKVEVCAWRDGLGRGYRKPEFLQKWKEQFKIIELNDYCEELLAIYTRAYTKEEILQDL